VVQLWGSSLARRPFFGACRDAPIKTPAGVEGLRVRDLPTAFKRLPDWNESIGYLYGWLAGYFAADGTVTKTGEVRLNSVDRESLEFVEDMCVGRLGVGTLGITSVTRPSSFDGRPVTMYALGLLTSHLPPGFFLLPHHRARAEHAVGRGRKEWPQWYVQSVEPTDRVEEVFCAVVPDTHSFTLDGNILVGNGMDGSRGTLVNGCVVRDSPTHALVAHHSHGVTFHDCISHNTTDIAYWWDDGVQNLSKDITYDRCVASKCYGRAAFRLGTVEDLRYGEISAMKSKCINCVAVDAITGNDGNGAFFWESGIEGVWIFENCVAHNCENNGIQIWQNSDTGHIIDGFIAYRCGSYGIKLGAYGNPYEFFRVRCVENGTAPFNQLTVAQLAYMGDPRTLREMSQVVDSYFDASGAPNAYWIASGSAVGGAEPMLVQNCRFKGYTQAALRVVEHNSEFPNGIRVEGCTFERADVPQIVLDPNVQSTFTWAIV
jgi:LAGLIDADG-like domain